jgi:hypothetical protein
VSYQCVERFKGDYHVRDLNYWNQFIQPFIGQLTSRNSLRDWRIFADFGEYWIKQVRPLYANSAIPNIDNEILTLDSTTISLSIKRMLILPLYTIFIEQVHDLLKDQF